ncbi:MAG: hypothetical protein IH861_00650 [Chloroflexi bacterium]|nr:hypothetical protein [Chloroflexota bacterium]
MLSHVSKFGIYLNDKERKVVRITSPYWFPEQPDWVYVTDEVNATILNIREMIRDKELSELPDDVTWGRIPLKDQAVAGRGDS